MTLQTIEQEEAQRLVLSRVAAAPDVWRGRATSAGGFLSAAAVASLWGLSQRVDALTTVSARAAGAAAILYVAAVCCFLAASVWPAAQSGEERTQDVAKRLYEDAKSESKPIRRLVLWGAWIAVGAIVATSVCGITLVAMPRHTTAWIDLPDKDSAQSVLRLCPELQVPFIAKVVDRGGANLELIVDNTSCDNLGGLLVVPKTNVTMLKDRP